MDPRQPRPESPLPAPSLAVSGPDGGEAPDRRRFLRRAGLAAAGAVGFSMPTFAALRDAAAQDGPTASPLGPSALGSTSTTAKANTVMAEADLLLLRTIESIERAAEDFYTNAVDTKLFTPVTAEVLRLFSRHHDEAAHLVQALIEADPAGAKAYEKKPAISNTVLEDELADALTTAAADADRAAGANGVLRIGFDLETSLVSTHLLALGLLETQLVAASIATILPVESQQAVVLGQLLDLSVSSYVPPFETETEALSPTRYAPA